MEIQEQNLNTQMNPLPRANQAGRSNPVKVTRIPFLRRVTVLQVSFQRVSENTFISSQSTPEASGEKANSALLGDSIHCGYLKSSAIIQSCLDVILLITEP